MTITSWYFQFFLYSYVRYLAVIIHIFERNVLIRFTLIFSTLARCSVPVDWLQWRTRLFQRQLNYRSHTDQARSQKWPQQEELVLCKYHGLTSLKSLYWASFLPMGKLEWLFSLSEIKYMCMNIEIWHKHVVSVFHVGVDQVLGWVVFRKKYGFNIISVVISQLGRRYLSLGSLFWTCIASSLSRLCFENY